MSTVRVNNIEPTTPEGYLDIRGFRLLELLLGGLKWKGIWNNNTPYQTNDLIESDGVLYKCVTSHTSSESFDVVNWTIVNPLI